MMFDQKWHVDPSTITTVSCNCDIRHNQSEIDLVDTTTSQILIDAMHARIESGLGFAVATLNLDHVVKLRSSPDFLAAYRRHTFVVADGFPIVLLRRLVGAPVERVTGADLVDPLMALAAAMAIPVGFLGSTQEALDAAAAILEQRYPGLTIVARIAPPFGLDTDGAEADAALAAMAAAGAKLCLLSLGAPKQEMLAVRGLAAVPGCGFVSVGAALDFIAGHQRRAPRWMRRLSLEWFWRLANDPRRLTRRYLACFAVLPALTWRALQDRRRHRQPLH